MHGAPRPTKALPPGALLLERFRLGARLGEGGSNTYRAMDEESGEEVAVELLACMPHPIDMDLVRNAVRPWQEADAIFLPVVHAVEQVSLGQDHCAIVVRELVEGDSLAELAGCCGVLPARAAKTVVARLLEVLRDLAGLDRGLVHGDLNPWNVILRDEDDEMVLVDVGLPKAVARDWSEDGNGSASWAQCVHRDFAAPEAVLATPGPRTDLYGAGGVLLFLLTGKSPLELQLEHGEDLKLQLKKLGVNEHLMVLLEYLLSPTEEGRLASPQQALEMLHSPAACPRRRAPGGAPGVETDWHLEPQDPGRRRWGALGAALAGLSIAPLLGCALAVGAPLLDVEGWVGASIRGLLALACAAIALRCLFLGLPRLGAMARTRLRGSARSLIYDRGDGWVELSWLQLTGCFRLGPLLVLRGCWSIRRDAPLEDHILLLAPVYSVSLSSLRKRVESCRAHSRERVSSSMRDLVLQGTHGPAWRPLAPPVYGSLALLAALLCLPVGARDDPQDVELPSGVGSIRTMDPEALGVAGSGAATTPEEAREQVEALLAFQQAMARVSVAGAAGTAKARSAGKAEAVSDPADAGPKPGSRAGSGSAGPAVVSSSQGAAASGAASGPGRSEEGALRNAASGGSAGDAGSGPAESGTGAVCPQGMATRELADARHMAAACGDEHGTMVRVAGLGEEPGYLLDWTEVTVADYGRCVADGACVAPGTASGCLGTSVSRGQHPVNCVDRDAAAAYCAWAGRRLCSGVEWQRAAEGRGGAPHPWGHEPADCSLAIVWGSASEWSSQVPGCGRDSSWPVGSRLAGVSPVGALDMVGNIAEWVSETGGEVRGGSYADQDPRLLSAKGTRVEFVGERRATIGFRCCRDE